MNCPNCGAENDADARFCAECGGPLENQDIEATVIGQNLRDLADDSPAVPASGEPEPAEEKTVTVDEVMLASAMAEEDNVSEENGVLEGNGVSQGNAASESKPQTPPPLSSSSSVTPAPGGGGTGSATPPPAVEGGDSNRKMWIVVGIVVLLVLCCCCCSIGVGGSIGSDPGLLEDLIDELSWLPAYLPLV